MPVFVRSKQSNKCERDDVSNGGQVRQLQEPICHKDNDMPVMIEQMKAIIVQLNVEGKFLGATSSTSVQIQRKYSITQRSFPICQQRIQSTYFSEVQQLKQLQILRCSRHRSMCTMRTASTNPVMRPLIAPLLPILKIWWGSRCNSRRKMWRLPWWS